MLHLIIVSVLVIVSTVLLGLFLTNAPLLPVQASVQAETVDWLFGVHWWFIAFFFSLITVFISSASRCARCGTGGSAGIEGRRARRVCAESECKNGRDQTRATIARQVPHLAPPQFDAGRFFIREQQSSSFRAKFCNRDGETGTAAGDPRCVQTRVRGVPCQRFIGGLLRCSLWS